MCPLLSSRATKSDSPMIKLKASTQARSRAPARQLVLCAVIIAVMIACSPSSAVSDRVGAQARKTGNVDLAELTSFNWDTVYIFSPYSGRDDMCRELPSSWADCHGTLPKRVAEGDFFVVFALGANVVHHETHARRNGDYCTSGCFLKLSRSEAKFRALALGRFPNGGAHYVLSRRAP